MCVCVCVWERESQSALCVVQYLFVLTRIILHPLAHFRSKTRQHHPGMLTHTFTHTQASSCQLVLAHDCLKYNPVYKKRKTNPAHFYFALQHTFTPSFTRFLFPSKTHTYAISLSISFIQNVPSITTYTPSVPLSLTHTDIQSHIHSVRKWICQIVIFSCSSKALAQGSLIRPTALQDISVCRPDLQPADSLRVICVTDSIDPGNYRLSVSCCKSCSEVRTGQIEDLCMCAWKVNCRI